MRRTVVTIACVVILLLSVAATVSGVELRVGKACVYSDGDLERFLTQCGDVTYVSFPGAQPWALLDDGRTYYPMPAEEVAQAISLIELPIGWIEMHIFILPAPRRDVLDCSAEGSVVFLSPGQVPYQDEHIHYTVVHEAGHVVHHILMPESRRDLWQAYAELRGIDYAEAAEAHAWRLHEIFAEDFRALFGGEMARFGGRVENHDIRPPEEIDGLREFFVSLLDRWRGQIRTVAYPNPFTDDVMLRAIGIDADPSIDEVTIFDVTGRVLRTFTLRSNVCDRLIWDGKNTHGKTVPPGVYIATIGTNAGPRIHKIIKGPE
jgi:hypothetical protein